MMCLDVDGLGVGLLTSFTLFYSLFLSHLSLISLSHSLTHSLSLSLSLLSSSLQDNPDEYIDTVLTTMDTLHSEHLIDCVDAFCETVGFSVEQTKRVFDNATKHSL